MKGKALFATMASALLFGILAAGLLADGFPDAPTPESPPWIGEALWVDRALDLAVQGFILLAGVFAIVLLLREASGGEATHG